MNFSAIKQKERCKEPTTKIKFVREGEKPPTTATANNLLQKAQAWEMRIDLGGRLQFPK